MQKAALQYVKVKPQVSADTTHRDEPFERFSPPPSTLFPVTEKVSIDRRHLAKWVEDWLADCRILQHSPRTIALRRTLFGRLFWFLDEHQFSTCTKRELRQFFAYLVSGHESEQGRWGRSESRFAKPLRPSTVRSYYNHLKAFFNWLVQEELVPESPMANLKPPRVPSDQVQPYSEQQIEALLGAAKKSKYPRRDYALVLLLLDTGMRTTELTQLKMCNLDLMDGTAYIVGKGNKKRTVCFGRKTARALRAYLQGEPRQPGESVFLSERGVGAGAPFTRWGVRQLIERLAKAANLPTERCGGHRLRHTMAVSYLRNGGNAFSLRQTLGHTSLRMTQQYVAFVDADLQEQHRHCSPADRTKS